MNSSSIIEYDNWDHIPNINSNILRGIYNCGFETPSPIQKKAISPIIEKKSIIAQAQSGTGKTCAFTTGGLHLINTELNVTQVLILLPTRELAHQVHDVVLQLSKYLDNFKSYLLVGGTSVSDDIKYLSNNTPHLLVSCPGRLMDMVQKNMIRLNEIKCVIIDEADEMLSFGFKSQILSILKDTNANKQICLFSATIPNELNTLINTIMVDPVKILVKQSMLTLEGISQYYIAFDEEIYKYDALKDLYTSINFAQTIIYCNSLRRVEYLYQLMLKDGFPVCCIHSNMEKNDRLNAYNEFKNGKYRICISSNVTARGIDIQQVSTVINFDIPKDVHTYLHRIGRSGRWGRKGTAINFITKQDIYFLKSIETYYNTQISELPASFVENS